MTKPKIRTIFFDVGGVLVDDFIGRKLAHLAEKHQFRNRLPELIRERKRLRVQVDLGKMSEQEFWTSLLIQAGTEASAEDLILEPFMREIPEVLAFAKDLNRRGFQTGILSNDSLQLSRLRRQRFGFDSIFDPILISAEHGLVKPDPRLYEVALAVSGTSPENTAFIDDRMENVDAAKQLGIWRIHFLNPGQLRTELLRLIGTDSVVSDK